MTQELETSDIAAKHGAASSASANLAQHGQTVDQTVLEEEMTAFSRRGSSHGLLLGGSPAVASSGRFELASEEISPGSSVLTFENPYYDVGGRTYVATDLTTLSLEFTGFVALQVSMTGPAPSASIVTFTEFVALQAAQKDYSKYVMPLYQLDKGSVVCDFRSGPPAVAWEFSD